MKIKIPVELANGAEATISLELSMSNTQKEQAKYILGLSEEDLRNALGQEFVELSHLIGVGSENLP